MTAKLGGGQAGKAFVSMTDSLKNVPQGSRESKPAVISLALKNLDNTIYALEDLAGRIAGNSPDIRKEEEKAPVPSVVELMEGLPGVLRGFEERLNKVHASITEMLF